MALLHLFVVFFKIGLFAIGGAYSFLPLVKQEAVQNHAWLSEAEFLDATAMVEVFPGAISIKFATYVGYKVAGIPGAIVANIANLLPPVLCMIAASWLYLRYARRPFVAGGLTMVRFAVLAMIVAIAVNLVDKKHPLEWKAVPVLVVTFLLMTLTKVHPAFLILGAALYGGLVR